MRIITIPNKKTIAYKKWISEERPIGKVIPVEFIEFKYNTTKSGIKYPFYKRGETVIGEIWRCYDENGNWLQCTFKHVVDTKNKNSSLEPNQSPIQDQFEPNLLIDSLEEWLNNHINKSHNPNKLLFWANAKHKKRLFNLKEMLNDERYTKEQRKIIFYILRHKESPTIPTLRAVQKVRENNPEMYNLIIEKANE